MTGFKEALRCRAFLFFLFACMCAYGCSQETGIFSRENGDEKFICAELMKEALEGYTAIPEKHMSPGRIVRIEVPGSDRVIVVMENYLSRNELPAELKLQVDDTQIDAGMLNIKPAERKEIEIELPLVMTGKHEIKAAAYFEKPDDLPEYEEYMEFTPEKVLKQFTALKPREPGETVHIGIFRGAGDENTAKYFNMFENARAEIIDSLSKPVIDKYDCLFIANSTEYVEHEYFGNLRMYAGEGGRGVVIQHAMLGRPGVRNNPFGERTPFPDIVPRMAARVEAFEVFVAAKHPALGHIEPGTAMRHMYFDHIVPETGPEAEVIVKNKEENPVVVVGRHGLGKVIFDGNVNISDGPAPASGLDGFNAHIARHGVEWLTGVELVGGGGEFPNL